MYKICYKKDPISYDNFFLMLQAINSIKVLHHFCKEKLVLIVAFC